MKLLIIGGTGFLGRHLVITARARDHEITTFNRGRHQAAAIPDVETIHGDRKIDLDRLRGRYWDAAIDTCGYLPHTITALLELLSDSIDRYVFISSISAYSDFSTIGIDESAPLKSLTSEELEQAKAIDASEQASAVNYGKLYGGLKAHCEQAAQDVLPQRVFIVRPGLIVGPYDYSDRFTYWVERVARGGEVLAPGRPNQYVQFIDVRDLAEWIVRMIERKDVGIFNANGLPEKLTMEDLLESCKVVSGSNASFTWVDEAFLLGENVAPWSDMPLWMPEAAAPHMKGFMFVRSDEAIAKGLTFRPLSGTISDTLAWRQTSIDKPLDAGIDSQKERQVLAKWHRKHEQVVPDPF